jgi:Zn-finger nucleic acid-binding protein
MKCPVCHDVSLEETELEPSLPARQCRQCGGRWLGLDHYLNWLKKSGESAASAGPSDPSPGEVGHSPKAKLCPQCGHLLRRRAVGNGITFGLDRCGSCGGFWFDRGEWESLKAHLLHRQIHLIFSDAWQHAQLRKAREEQHEQALREKLGTEDYEQIHKIRAWLIGHRHRAELIAVLLTGAAGAMVANDKAGRGSDL